MRFTKRSHTTLFLLLLLLFLFASTSRNVNATARVDDDVDVDNRADEYDETARVVRISLLRGDVQLRRAGNDSTWERATLNLPLVEGDTITTGHDAHVEIQIDARNFVRVGEDAALRVATLRDEGIALSLEAGTASVRLARFDRDKEYFEVDAPKTTVAVERTGLYRIDVSQGGNVRVTVRDKGQARIYSDTSGFTLREGKTAQLITNGAEAGDWNLSAATSFDAWDDWADTRERYLASRLQYENRDRYYDRDVWGAEELDAYGDWSYVNDYGWVWRPRVTVINNYNNWAPYRYGHWRWCAPYGWTWIADEEWGWAPYHYGRWVSYDNYWCWVPHSQVYRHTRNWWRPALVAFVYIPTSHGEHVAWYPLGYRQHDPRSRHYRQQARNAVAHVASIQEIKQRRYTNSVLRGVTTLPVRDFGREMERAQPAAPDLARRAVIADPVRGRLPIAPVNVAANNQVSLPGRTRAGNGDRIARPAAIDGTVSLPERRMGAGVRQPGVPLDDELRRARVYRGREPRASAHGINTGNVTGDTTVSNTVDTGVIARPINPGRQRAIERRRIENENSESAPSIVRPSRPRRPDPRSPEPQDERTVRPGVTVETPEEPREQMPRVEPPERKQRRERREQREQRSEPLPRTPPESSEPSASAPQPERNAPRPEPPAPRHERPSAPDPAPPRHVEREQPPTAAPRAREHKDEPREAPARPSRDAPARPQMDQP